MTIAEQQVMPTVSIGIADGRADSDPEQLLRDASLALRKAKNNGRDRYEFADAGLAVEAQHRLSLEAEIREGLRDGQFVPWFQPIISLATGRLAGYEALVRWVRPEGVAEPGSLPRRGRTHGPHPSTSTSPSSAGRCRRWPRCPQPLFVAVNVTATTLARTPYADVVIQSLAELGADPARLHLEVTETVLLEPLRAGPRAPWSGLAELGVRWYVDDFGTGYSSISHLRDLPVAGLKLDQSFTAGIGAGDATSMQLADALVGLADGLALDTVAEGVETAGRGRLPAHARLATRTGLALRQGPAAARLTTTALVAIPTCYT